VRNSYIYIFILFTLLRGGSAANAQWIEFPPPVPLEMQRPLDEETRRLQRSAMQYENSGEYEKALDIYRRIFSQFPDYDPFYDGVIRELILLERYDAGMAFTDSLRSSLLAHRPINSLTLTEQERVAGYMIDGGRFAGRAGRREEAFQRWNEIYQLPQPSANAFFRLMNAMIDARLPDGLEEMARKARKATGDPSLLAASLASYWASRGQVEKAIQEWLSLLELQPRQADNIQRQILALPEDERTRSEVIQALEAARGNNSIKLPVTETLAQLYFRDRNWEKAYQEVRSADQLGGNSGEAMLDFAETLNSEAEFELALKVLDDLEKTHPQISATPRALLVRGKALAARGIYERADSIFSLLTDHDILRSAQEQDALLLQAELKLKYLRQPAAARELINAKLAKNPRLRQRGELMLFIAESYVAQENLQEALKVYLQTAEGNFPGEQEIRSRAMVNAARVELCLGRIASALERLNQAARFEPEGLLTNDALEWAAFLQQAQSDSLNLVSFARADMEVRLGHPEQADSLFRRIADQTSSDELAERSLWRNAEIQRASGRYDRAIATLQESLRRFAASPRAPELLLSLAEIFERDKGDAKSAIVHYEKILVDYPDSLPAQEARRRIRRIESSNT
jgi:tetratricopeptide (TPR) repeat protein